MIVIGEKINGTRKAVQAAIVERDAEAIRALQEFVNAQGGEQLQVTGICDTRTLDALMYCYDYGITVGGQNQQPDPEPELPEATDAPEQPQQSGITPDSAPETISHMQ